MRPASHATDRLISADPALTVVRRFRAPSFVISICFGGFFGVGTTAVSNRTAANVKGLRGQLMNSMLANMGEQAVGDRPARYEPRALRHTGNAHRDLKHPRHDARRDRL
ncbi:MAG: hypothetical protein AAFO89_00345 [Planctomycetota bacterium]